ncbi:MAG TPA: type II toxin-antitoxin system RelE/ParE family toxin [Thermoanaerobaculia bacterium]|jgi:plasmid stabilization system protein ParE
MRVELHPAADGELAEIGVYLEGERDGYGGRFLDAWQGACDLLLRYEAAGSPRSRDVRFKNVPGFPYDVVYQVRGDVIFILAIAHQSRRPGYWRDRLR